MIGGADHQAEPSAQTEEHVGPCAKLQTARTVDRAPDARLHQPKRTTSCAAIDTLRERARVPGGASELEHPRPASAVERAPVPPRLLRFVRRGGLALSELARLVREALSLRFLCPRLGSVRRSLIVERVLSGVQLGLTRGCFCRLAGLTNLVALDAREPQRVLPQAVGPKHRSEHVAKAFVLFRELHENDKLLHAAGELHADPDVQGVLTGHAVDVRHDDVPSRRRPCRRVVLGGRRRAAAVGGNDLVIERSDRGPDVILGHRTPRAIRSPFDRVEQYTVCARRGGDREHSGHRDREGQEGSRTLVHLRIFLGPRDHGRHALRRTTCQNVSSPLSNDRASFRAVH